MAKKITPSMEAYLEIIKKIEREKKVVRVKGVAKMLNVKMPSVTEALKNLSRRGLIKHERYGHIELTSHGNDVAEEINSRHRALFSFFGEILGIEPERADADACKIEHVISETTMKRLIKFVHFIKNYLGEDDLLDNFRNYLEEHKGVLRK